MREHNLRAALLAGLSLTVLTNIQPASARNDFWQPFFRDNPYPRSTPADADRDEPKRKPKKKAEILWRFTKSGQFEYGCLIPGHREAGMTGTVVVK